MRDQLREPWEPLSDDDQMVLQGQTDKPRLLIVDDEEAALDLLISLFETEDLDLRATRSGQEALGWIEERVHHVVLTDLYMRPVNGTEVLRAAKERCPHTEVVVITGHASLDRALEALHHHAFDFVEKPFEIEKLERVIQNAITQSQLSLENLRLIRELQEQNRMLEERIRLATRELAELSVRDELTGLFNYRHMQTTLENEISRSRRYSRPVSLAMLDLDHFKHYNDNHGHQAGNTALRAVADVMLKGIRRADTAARYGGEEFAIIFPETDKEEARKILERIRQDIQGLNLEFEGPQGKRILTVSAGVATCPEDTDVLDEFIVKADDALYAAKARGRDQLVLASPVPQDMSDAKDRRGPS